MGMITNPMKNTRLGKRNIYAENVSLRARALLLWVSPTFNISFSNVEMVFL